MSDLSVAEVRYEEDATGVLSEFRSPQGSEPSTTTADLPRTFTQVTGHADGYEDAEKIPPRNAQRIDAEQVSKFVTVFSPISPPSSDSRASLRTEVLNGSPLERRGFNKPSLSFGSVVANAPAPVFTGTVNRPYDQPRLLERPSLMQMPTPSLEGSVNNNDGPRTEDSRPVSKLCRATAPTLAFNSRTAPLGQYGNSNTDQITTFQTMDDIMGINPYMRRADEIGFSHQVPNVGHLGRSLKPPGWKEGDPPITPDEAWRLFDIDHQNAVHNFETSLASQGHQNAEDRGRFRIQLNDQWHAQRLFYEKLLQERLFIYDQHNERQQRKIERLRESGYGLSQNCLAEVSQPMQPQAMASHMPAPLLESACRQKIPPTYPNQMDGPCGYPRTSQNVGSWQSHKGPEKSPIALDHNQMSIRMGSAYAPHQANTAEIARQSLDDQQYFNEHESANRLCGAQEQLLQRAHISSNNVHPAVFSEGNNPARSSHGCPPEKSPISQYRLDPFTYNGYPHVEPSGSGCPPVSSPGSEDNSFCRPAQHHPVQSGHESSVNTDIYHGSDNLPFRGRQYEQNPHHMTPETEFSPTRDRSMRRGNPLMNSRIETNKAGGPNIIGSYASELDGLSRQEPSHEIQFGQREDATVSRLEPHRAQQSNRKAKGARKTSLIPTTMKEPPGVNERTAETKADNIEQWFKNEAQLAKLPTLIPSKEFVRAALEDAERDDEGAKSTRRKRRPRPDVDATRGFSISDEAVELFGTKGVIDNRRNPRAGPSGVMPGRNTVIPNVTPAPGGLSSTYEPGLPQNANYLFSRDEGVTPESENGSERFEDPNDGDYGKRTTRRKSTTPRKKPASRSNAALNKKRKAAVSITPVKRSRLSMDGPAYESEDDAEGSDDTAKGNRN